MKPEIRDVSYEEGMNVKGGEVITIGLVCAVLSIAILSVFVWKFFTSDSGKASFPGGFSFEWSTIMNFLLNGTKKWG
ncbi:MAG: hypothetical protein IJV94_02275 [Bacilli bacterium]|nr:hypothetical protein [Bacilli bacterium]